MKKPTNAQLVPKDMEAGVRLYMFYSPTLNGANEVKKVQVVDHTFNRSALLRIVGLSSTNGRKKIKKMNQHATAVGVCPPRVHVPTGLLLLPQEKNVPVLPSQSNGPTVVAAASSI